MYSPLSTCIDTLHSQAGDSHHIASPMGLWLLLAVASTVTEENSLARQRIEKTLGLPVPQAIAVVEELLDTGEQTDALKSAVALWIRGNSLTEIKEWGKGLGVHVKDEIEGETIYQWRDGLGDFIEKGELPSSENADKWVSENTVGLIEKLPIKIDEETFLVMVTALATKTTWLNSFDEVPNRNFLNGTFSHASKVLVSHEKHGVFVEDTEVGLVGVHVAYGSNGLVVYSVIAEENIDYQDVIKAAHAVASHDSPDNCGLPIYKLETEETDFHTVENTISSTGDIKEAYLPKWKIKSSHQDLQDVPALAIQSLVESVAIKSGMQVEDVFALLQQDVVAEYTKDGFDAAAITQLSMMARSAALIPETSPAKKLTLNFDHPYAVVAVIRDKTSWSETPVFSGWVKEAL